MAVELKIIEGGKVKQPGGKTGKALNELKSLLKLASADGKIDDDELRAVMRWRTTHRTVLRRMPLQPFDDWLEEALADGNVNDEERRELLNWADRLGEEQPEPKANAPTPSPTVSRDQTGDEYLAIPKSRRPSWKSDPATAKQIAFLLDLGESERACHGLTKGEASARISALLETERETRHGSRGGGDYGYEPPTHSYHVPFWVLVLALAALGVVVMIIRR